MTRWKGNIEPTAAFTETRNRNRVLSVGLRTLLPRVMTGKKARHGLIRLLTRQAPTIRDSGIMDPRPEAPCPTQPQGFADLPTRRGSKIIPSCPTRRRFPSGVPPRPLKFHEGPRDLGLTGGSSNRCRLACGTAESRRIIDFW